MTTETTSREAAPPDFRRRRRTARRVMAVWGVAVLLFFLWQTIRYRGIPAMLAEWEFGHLGRAYPAVTLTLLVALFVSPALLYWRWASRWLRRRSRGPAVAALELYGLRFFRVLVALAAGFAVAALVVLLPILRDGADGGPPVPVTVGTPGAAAPREGPTRLVGTVRYDRIAILDNDLVVTDHRNFFAPVQPAPGPHPGIRFFVEVPDARPGRPATAAVTGILRRDRLPGALIRLFRYAGYTVEQPHYVLYATRGSMHWPFLATSAQLGVVALLAALAAAFQRWRLGRIRAHYRGRVKRA